MWAPSGNSFEERSRRQFFVPLSLQLASTLGDVFTHLRVSILQMLTTENGTLPNVAVGPLVNTVQHVDELR